MELSLIGILIFVLDAYAIIMTMRSDASIPTRLVWSVAIILLPVLGFLAWLLFGPGKPRAVRA